MKSANNLLPVQKGDFCPCFCLPDHLGKDREIQLYGGRNIVLFFLPLQNQPYLDDFFPDMAGKLDRFSAARAQLVCIVPGTIEKAATLRSAFGHDVAFFADENGGVCRAFGFDGVEPLSFLIDPNLKIMARFAERNALNHLGDVVRAAEKEKFDPAAGGPVASGVQAPVLIVPDVVDEALQDEILSYWRNGQKYTGTIGVEGKDKVDMQGKRRIDVDVRDRDLLMKIDNRLCRSVFPEVRKVAGFEVRYRDRYKIGCYMGDQQGYYNRHRDTGVEALAHRRYSMSLCLSGGFEGGYLEFPEYGNVRYRLAPRSAVLFPSGLLHRVSPVTSGERYIMVSFFHGEAEEPGRRAYIEARGQKYNPDDVRVLCETHFPDIEESAWMCTRSETA